MWHCRKKILLYINSHTSLCPYFSLWYSQIRNCDWHCQNKMCLAKSFMQTSTGLTEGKIKIKSKQTAPYHVWVASSSIKKIYKSTTQHPENNNTLSQRQTEKKEKKKRMKFLSSGILAIFIFHYPKSIKLSQLHFQQLWANYSAAPQQFSPRLNNSYWIRYFYCSLTRNQIH